jgi:hypothetical protein
MTVDDLIWDLFVDFLTEDAGFIPGKHRLIGYVPDECGDSREPEPIPHSRAWRTMLQRCHNVGDKECKFIVLDGNVQKHQEPEAAVTHENSYGHGLLTAVPFAILVLGALVYLLG